MVDKEIRTEKKNQRTKSNGGNRNIFESKLQGNEESSTEIQTEITDEDLDRAETDYHKLFQGKFEQMTKKKKKKKK